MGRAFLTDFGLAKVAATGSKYTRTGDAIGTPSYMAPEQARGEIAALTAAADVWSLGIVLFECLAGRPAYDGPVGVVIAAVATHPPPVLEDPPIDVPSGLRAVLTGCLQAPAADRYPTAAALRDDLDRCLRGEAPTCRPGPPARQRARVVVGAVGALGLAAVLTLLWRGREPASAPAAAPTAAARLAAQASDLRHRDPAAAADRLGEALVHEPGRAAWRLEQGLLLWATGAGDRAREAWLAVPAGTPEAPRARLYLGLEGLLSQRADGGGPDLDAAAATPGEVGTLARATIAVGLAGWSEARALLGDRTGWIADLLRGLANEPETGGDAAVARRAYERALAEGPQFAWAWQHLANACLPSRDFGAARDAFDQALRVRPGFPMALAGRAAVRMELRDYDGALADLDLAIAGDPREVRFPIQRAEVLLALGDPEAAHAAYTQALAAAPDSIPGRLGFARCLERLGRAAEAMTAYAAVLDLDPRQPAARFHRGLLRQAQGDHPGAIEDLDVALQHAPAHVTARLKRATAKTAIGDMAGALADADAALAVQPDSSAALALRAHALGQLKRRDEALAVYDALCAAEPRDGQHRVNRGAVKEAAGDVPGALADYLQARRDEPTLAAAAACEAMLRRRLGDLPAAQAAMRDALRLAATPGQAEDARAFLAQCERELAGRR